MKEITDEEVINGLIKNTKVNTNLISDGYHTFGELYNHRLELYLALCRIITHDPQKINSGTVWKSKFHSDGSAIEDWFILGIGSAEGNQITYHLPMSRWDDAWFAIHLPVAPPYDGHTPDDVLNRLTEL
jgi:hypothetical protein